MHFSEMNESNGMVRLDYLEEGIMFPHGTDNDGKLMFIIRCKLHFKNSKDPEECKKCAVYWFERMERYIVTLKIIDLIHLC